MTKEIKNYKLRLILWLEKRREKEIKTDKELSKQAILYHLTHNKSTQESIEMYLEIKEKYRQLMQERLLRVSEEKVALEQFLS